MCHFPVLSQAQTSDMGKKNSSKSNPVWNFITSVKLAVFLLLTLAVTSIIGTVIPQGEPLQRYLEHYGPAFFKVIKALHLYDTYNSWWFLTLLGLFALNLIACTIRRIPFTIKLWKRDSLALDLDRLMRFRLKKQWKVAGKPNPHILEKIKDVFQKEAGSVTAQKELESGQIFMVERGKWSYWGLYGLHASILIVLVGAVIGSLTGFKGNLMLPEGEAADHVLDRKSGQPQPLGFSIRCDKFTVSFYDTGAPKEFRSDVTILENGKEILKTPLRVNAPLTYKGITFYQASYQPMPEAQIRLISPDGKETRVTLPAFQKVPVPDLRLVLGLYQYLPDVHGVPAVRVWIEDGSSPARTIWVLKGNAKEFSSGSNTYRVSLVDVRNKYMTGLQVKKDPGVWIVWLGFFLMIAGFVVVFWVPHRRIYLWVGEQGGKAAVVLAGQSNKNKIHFEKDFEKVAEAIEKSLEE